MRKTMGVALLVTGILVGYAAAAETPPSLVDSYKSLADVILAANRTEEHVVTAILESHWRAAREAWRTKDYETAAAQMALFANEGDNAVGGIRKRLLEGGHHHNAQGEAQGRFDPGHVIVDRKTKQAVLAEVSSLRAAQDDAGRQAAWDAFSNLAKGLLSK
jgi:hypothetical protein